MFPRRSPRNSSPSSPTPDFPEKTPQHGRKGGSLTEIQPDFAVIVLVGQLSPNGCWRAEFGAGNRPAALDDSSRNRPFLLFPWNCYDCRLTVALAVFFLRRAVFFLAVFFLVDRLAVFRLAVFFLAVFFFFFGGPLGRLFLSGLFLGGPLGRLPLGRLFLSSLFLCCHLNGS